jgi:hypothetical protein
MISHIRMTFTTLPLKRNHLLFGGLFLVTIYRTGIEFVLSSKTVLAESRIRVRAPKCVYRYSTEVTIYAVLFTKTVSINY